MSHRSDEPIQVILQRGNSYPRTLKLSKQSIDRFLMAVLFASIIGVAALGVSLRLGYLWYSGVKPAVAEKTNSIETDVDSMKPTDNQALQEQVGILTARIKNLTAQQDAKFELETKGAVFSLFSPNVIDKTKDQDQISAKNFAFKAGRVPSLSFELHNNHPDQSVQKGYIVVLARNRGQILSYPDIMNIKGPYLLDFEHGESFQVARFRMVNAQFEGLEDSEPQFHFQVLIFTRAGELLLNLLSEVSKK